VVLEAHLRAELCEFLYVHSGFDLNVMLSLPWADWAVGVNNDIWSEKKPLADEMSQHIIHANVLNFPFKWIKHVSFHLDEVLVGVRKACDVYQLLKSRVSLFEVFGRNKHACHSDEHENLACFLISSYTEKV
jgi:hypothetical protein